MEYTDIVCDTQNIPECRFILKNKGTKPLIVLGLNPSTADESESDATIRKIIGFISRWNEAKTKDFDSFIMVNLYPLRETSPVKLLQKTKDENIHKRNLEILSSLLDENPFGHILLCYGDSVELVKWLKKCRDDIFTLLNQYPCLHLYRLGNLTHLGNPRHPSRLSYNTELTPF